ncbi:hypothetical protein CAPTEDRAFT_191890 [Capitella teleta]|uniref:Homeobox domain-containing protein n=1 Tax=Capitella teleta TaxID=283909 RepID=R7VHM4_CAPTE|nr:hypothetical protein CAPTEDRAFT_191890 [Capitella teleta]|eukprot:ELU18119.1 hypothetical protein CAPTEDRAFT_191890 [Capitella teleta]
MGEAFDSVHHAVHLLPNTPSDREEKNMNFKIIEANTKLDCLWLHSTDTHGFRLLGIELHSKLLAEHSLSRLSIIDIQQPPPMATVTIEGGQQAIPLYEVPDRNLQEPASAASFGVVGKQAIPMLQPEPVVPSNTQAPSVVEPLQQQPSNLVGPRVKKLIASKRPAHRTNSPYTKEAVDILHDVFVKNNGNIPDHSAIRCLAGSVGMTTQQIRKWFSNKRNRLVKNQEAKENRQPTAHAQQHRR